MVHAISPVIDRLIPLFSWQNNNNYIKCGQLNCYAYVSKTNYIHLHCRHNQICQEKENDPERCTHVVSAVSVLRV